MLLLLLLLLLLCFSFNPSLLCHLPQGRALYTIRHRIGQQGTKDKGTTGDKRQRGRAQQAHRHRKDNRGPKTEGQQGTKDRETFVVFYPQVSSWNTRSNKPN